MTNDKTKNSDKEENAPQTKARSELDYFFDEAEDADKPEETFGDKVKRLRQERDYSHNYLANETGFTTEFLKQIEENEVHPSVSTILQLSKALQVESGMFLSSEAETEATQKRVESYRKRTDSYSYESLTQGAGAKHMKAFVVSIDSMQDHKGVDYHHDGEEFIYVLEGRIEVMVGENRNILNEHESLHFNSSITHKIRNLTEKTAKFIVVVYTP